MSTIIGRSYDLFIFLYKQLGLTPLIFIYQDEDGSDVTDRLQVICLMYFMLFGTMILSLIDTLYESDGAAWCDNTPFNLRCSQENRLKEYSNSYLTS